MRVLCRKCDFLGLHPHQSAVPACLSVCLLALSPLTTVMLTDGSDRCSAGEQGGV